MVGISEEDCGSWIGVEGCDSVIGVARRRFLRAYVKRGGTLSTAGVVGGAVAGAGAAGGVVAATGSAGRAVAETPEGGGEVGVGVGEDGEGGGGEVGVCVGVGGEASGVQEMGRWKHRGWCLRVKMAWVWVPGRGTNPRENEHDGRCTPCQK